jgi:hypothetical protein
VTPDNLDRLATLAKAATPGPWEPYSGTSVVQSGPPSENTIDKPLYYFSVDCFGPNPLEDAAYIAALDPTTVLDLIAMATRLEDVRQYVSNNRDVWAEAGETSLIIIAYADIYQKVLNVIDTGHPLIAQPTGEATE